MIFMLTIQRILVNCATGILPKVKDKAIILTLSFTYARCLNHYNLKFLIEFWSSTAMVVKFSAALATFFINAVCSSEPAATF